MCPAAPRPMIGTVLILATCRTGQAGATPGRGIIAAEEAGSAAAWRVTCALTTGAGARRAWTGVRAGAAAGSTWPTCATGYAPDRGPSLVDLPAAPFPVAPAGDSGGTPTSSAGQPGLDASCAGLGVTDRHEQMTTVAHARIANHGRVARVDGRKLGNVLLIAFVDTPPEKWLARAAAAAEGVDSSRGNGGWRQRTARAGSRPHPH